MPPSHPGDCHIRCAGAARIGDDPGTMSCPRRHAAVAVLVFLSVLAPRALGAQVHLPSRPETVVWGEIPIDRPPALRIKPGTTVTVDTLSHQGATQDESPATFLAKLGVAPGDVLTDAVDFWRSRPGRPREGRAGHILTGPIYIDGAEPGDALEIRIEALSLRTPFGMNGGGPAAGVLGTGYTGTRDGDPVPAGAPRVIRTRTDNGQGVAVLNDRLVVPLQPFMGIMAVAPPRPVVGQPGITVDGVQSTRPPGAFGGNLDYKDLTTGASLFLPVFHAGAQVYIGDPHSVQGDGEVNGTAIEHSLTGRFTFVLHKGKTLKLPRAETPTHHVVMGIDVDLDRAMRMAVQEAVDYLIAEKHLSPADAYLLASIACDFHVAEAVDLTQVIVGKIPKHVFR
jgi:acetamidase/formamidase